MKSVSQYIALAHLVTIVMFFPIVAFTQSTGAKQAEDEVFIQQVLADVKENQ